MAHLRTTSTKSLESPTCEVRGPLLSRPFTTTINNEYFPMKPGTTFLYKGGTEHSEMTVNHDTRKVMGVECIVVDHKEWEGDMLIERTHDWFAQDKKGTVWYFGENTKEYENGEVVSTKGSWEAGGDGAKPGINFYGGERKAGDLFWDSRRGLERDFA
jgi:hypothetical protein